MAEENKNQAPETKAKKAAEKSLRDVVAEFGKETEENKAKGKEPVKLSLTNKFKIEFVQDYVGFKKGDSAEVSELAKEFYVQNGHAKVLR